MAGQLTLALLEAAPDRESAQLLLVAALDQGVGADSMRAAWHRWETNHSHARRRGEVT